MTKLLRNIASPHPALSLLGRGCWMLLVGLLCLPAVPSADTAQYFYDELGNESGGIQGCRTITASAAH